MSPPAGNSSEQFQEVSLLLSRLQDFQEHPGSLRNAAIPAGWTTLQPPHAHGAAQTPKLFPSNEISVWAWMLQILLSPLSFPFGRKGGRNCKHSYFKQINTLTWSKALTWPRTNSNQNRNLLVWPRAAATCYHTGEEQNSSLMRMFSSLLAGSFSHTTNRS